MTVTVAERLLDQCIHCGLCLPACPTYRVFRTEMEGPRGRIDLVRALAHGQIEVGGAFRTHLDLCLGCRSCESACPSGVRYGKIVEAAHATLASARRRGLPERFARRLVLHHLIPFPARLRALAVLVAVYQACGLPRVVRPLLPGWLRALEALLPRVPLRKTVPHGGVFPAEEPRRGRVAFFHGCLQDALLDGVNGATIRVLQRNGFEVVVPRGQTCCAALTAHVGEADLSRALARRNIEAFERTACDAIVNNAGGCGAILEDYGRLLAGDPAFAQRATRFAEGVRDVQEFLAERGLVPPECEVPVRAVYVDSCHLRHAQRVIRAPRDVLRTIPGLQLVEARRPDACCGSAGTYNIVHPEVARAILDAKLADLRQTGADTIATANTGCYLQMRRGVASAGLSHRVVHVMELLDEAYGR